MEVDLGIGRVVYELLGVVGNSGNIDIGINDQVVEEQLIINEGFVFFVRLMFYDIMIWWVEG